MIQDLAKFSSGRADLSSKFSRAGPGRLALKILPGRADSGRKFFRTGPARPGPEISNTGSDPNNIDLNDFSVLHFCSVVQMGHSVFSASECPTPFRNVIFYSQIFAHHLFLKLFNRHLNERIKLVNLSNTIVFKNKGNWWKILSSSIIIKLFPLFR